MPVPAYFKPKPKTFDPLAISGLSRNELIEQLEGGGRFVVYQWVVSMLVLTIRRNSPVYFIRAGATPAARSWPFSLIAFLFGWWGIPWGILWTPKAIYQNFRGGTDITPKVLVALGWHESIPVGRAN